ncbi:MAG: hypothetical protein CMB80_15350 [Flammeovirgaceae bacterium]|nr:hypothetical protein [Flammeovirgaceae bacterium]|tara:strand:- start:993 stop:3662 length:2670 start_codon:yes stop_codon:yes gene_type:complete
MNNPPKIALKFFRWFCREDLQKYIEGDLFELFEEQVETKGLNKARLLFTWEVLKLFRPDIIRLNRSITQINQWTMFKNYLKVGIRNILKYKTFSFINVFGLAVAMSVAMLIILMIVDQKQADRFHEHTERMSRVVTRSDDGPRNASTPIPLAEALQEEPSVEHVTQLVKGVGGDLVFPDGQSSTEIRGFFADDQFFKVFGFELVQGNANSALSNPRSIVISQRVAERLFDGDAVGKSVTFTDRGLDPIQIDLGMSNGKEARDWGGFIISGVVDVASVKSHIQFDALISVASIEPLVKANQLDENLQNNVRNWALHSGAYTYVLQKESTSQAELTASLQRIMADKKDLIGEKSFEVQSFSEINLGEFMGTPISLRLPIEAYYVLSILALVILISAILNYTNLSIARSLTRSKEIGVRKVNGATKNDIFSQFMVESVLIAFISLFVANGMLLLLKPMFQSMWVIQQLQMNLWLNLTVFIAFVVFTMVVGVFAGIYPASVLSRFAPTRILARANASGSGKLKTFINVTQFVFSLFFIVTSIAIAKQFEHYLSFDYGMNTQDIINLPLQGNDYEIMMTELKSVPGVEMVSACHLIPAMPNNFGTYYSLDGDSEGDWFQAELMSVHPNTLSTLDLPLIAGRNLDNNSKRTNQLVINEFASELMGYESPQEALNQTIYVGGHEGQWQIIGVVEDFKFQALISGAGDKSLLMRYDPAYFNYLNVKVASTENEDILVGLEEKWASVDPVHQMQFYYFDESLAKSNQWLGDVASVIGFIAVLAIIISCLGLLGMTVYSTERRVKEIGIRKVLGASPVQLILILGRSFLIMIGVAIIIAAPMSFFVNRLWIDNIPNQVSFGWGTVLLGTAMMLVLASITILSQVFKVSRTNPVESLQYE